MSSPQATTIGIRACFINLIARLNLKRYLGGSRLTSFAVETVAEQAVPIHEKRCGGQRRGAET